MRREAAGDGPPCSLQKHAVCPPDKYCSSSARGGGAAGDVVGSAATKGCALKRSTTAALATLQLWARGLQDADGHARWQQSGGALYWHSSYSVCTPCG
eukprot:scaffold4102_cov404-Prasinococcus_capsulatus_cf.AAC.5